MARRPELILGQRMECLIFTWISRTWCPAHWPSSLSKSLQGIECQVNVRHYETEPDASIVSDQTVTSAFRRSSVRPRSSTARHASHTAVRQPLTLQRTPSSIQFFMPGVARMWLNQTRFRIQCTIRDRLMKWRLNLTPWRTIGRHDLYFIICFCCETVMISGNEDFNIPSKEK
jgi:hypothetical protein